MHNVRYRSHRSPSSKVLNLNSAVAETQSVGVRRALTVSVRSSSITTVVQYFLGCFNGQQRLYAATESAARRGSHHSQSPELWLDKTGRRGKWQMLGR
jgi:hypothetical protein